MAPLGSGLIDAGEQFYKGKRTGLVSSHMLDLAEERWKEKVHTSVEFFKLCSPLGMASEIELGVTGW